MHCYKAENRGLDQEIFELLCDQYHRQPCHQAMGFEVTYLGKGIAGLRMVTDLRYTTKGERVHGGAIASIADTVMSLAASTCGHIYRTAEMKLNYIAPVYARTELNAEARVVHPGKTLAVVEAEFHNSEGKLIGKSMGTFFRDPRTPLGEEGDQV